MVMVWYSKTVNINLVNFIQIKNNFSSNPPNSLDTYSIDDTGSTKKYIKVSTPGIKNTALVNATQVIIPYRSLMQATHWVDLDLITLLITRDSTAYILPHMQ